MQDLGVKIEHNWTVVWSHHETENKDDRPEILDLRRK